MRRSDREVKDFDTIKEVMEKCEILHLGLNDKGKVYIVPLNFGYKMEKDEVVIYFHGAMAGRKLDVIKSNPEAGFEMETGYQLKSGEIACNYTAAFQSIIGNGTVKVLDKTEEKETALNRIMLHNTEKADWIFSEKMLKNTCVYALTVKELSCKIHE